MTKKEIIDAVSERTGLEKNVCQTVFEEAINEIAEATKRGETITIRGLFTIAPRFRKGRKGQNIPKGTTIEIPDHCVPFAKFCKEIKDALYDHHE